MKTFAINFPSMREAAWFINRHALTDALVCITMDLASMWVVIKTTEVNMNRINAIAGGVLEIRR